MRTPFPWTYLAYASGCDLSGPDRRARWGDRADAAGWTRARLLGHLLARDAGDCFEFALHLRDGHWGLALDVVRADGAWTRTPTARSLALPLLLEAVTTDARLRAAAAAKTVRERHDPLRVGKMLRELARELEVREC